MGHYKGKGICWSGQCTNPGTIDGGIDANGDPVWRCADCHAKVIAALKAAAQRILLEHWAPSPTSLKM